MAVGRWPMSVGKDDPGECEEEVEHRPKDPYKPEGPPNPQPLTPNPSDSLVESH